MIRSPSHSLSLVYCRPTPKIPPEFLDNVRVFQGLACVKNPSTRRANQWPYPPDSDTLAPREQLRFLPDEDEDTPTTTTVNQGQTADDAPMTNEPSNFNFEGLAITSQQQETLANT
jgi:hypothetical protein